MRPLDGEVLQELCSYHVLPQQLKDPLSGELHPQVRVQHNAEGEQQKLCGRGDRRCRGSSGTQRMDKE